MDPPPPQPRELYPYDVTLRATVQVIRHLPTMYCFDFRATVHMYDSSSPRPPNPNTGTSSNLDYPVDKQHRSANLILAAR
jgi:hypothetical protein